MRKWLCRTIFLGPLVYINKESKFTLALGLQQFIGYYTAQWELLMAAATMVLVPPIMLFMSGKSTLLKALRYPG